VSLTNLIFLLALAIGSSQGVPVPDAPAGVTIGNVKFQTFTAVSSTSSVVGTPGSNPNRLPLPTDGSAVRIDRTELHAYSMDLNNQGTKTIKALSWDFIFTDPATNTQLLRRSFANLQEIAPAKHQTVKFTTSLSAPKTVSAADLAKKSSPFRRSTQLQCVLFTDGSTWEQADAQGKACERLQRWLERRKTWHPELEDLPFNP